MSGDVLRLKSARHYAEDGKSWFELKPNKGAVMVAIIVGSESLKDPTPEFDFVAAMARLGYQPMADDAELARLREIEAAARRYVASVNGGPEDDAWDTEDGKFAEGAARVTSDSAWKAYDDEKQLAFDVLSATVTSDASADD
ncbi:hypothetical protein G6L37_07205 [Agrobacterium rubi]|nr:hypothetical protein [Agrobacterium rubi]NTF25154.1 hypothetical protein [Agrobacterium rubi]